ncbi:MAG: clostripain-related cysteine peptidase, partial [Candidatus Helarchaeota archaeon]
MWGSSPGGVCWDDSNGQDYLTLSELKSVLSSQSVDLLGFDACLMGAVEVHYQLKDIAGLDAIVGSEEVEPGAGYPYDTILAWLQSNPTATPQELAQQIVLKYDDSYPTYYEITQASANILSTQFLNSLNNFIDDLDAIAGSQGTNIQNARGASQEFEDNSYIDLYDFANEIQSRCTGAVITSASNLKTEILNIIIEEKHSSHYPDVRGLSIYFPTSQSGYSTQYENNDFASNTNWDEFLKHFYSGTDGSGGGSVNIDDQYEENDFIWQAPELNTGSYNLICNGTDQDFFNITVSTGYQIQVDILFDNDDGDLDLYLINKSWIIVDSSITGTDNEQVTFTAKYNGNYTIWVKQKGTIMEYQSYQMIVDFGIDDPLENVNDDWSSPTIIVVNTTYTNLICRDSDFYAFQADEGYLINITIWFNYFDGDLDLYYWDYYKEYLIDASYTATSSENILAAANYSGTAWYKFEVYNYNDNYNYSMRVDVSWADDIYEDNDYLNEAPLIGYGNYYSLSCLDYDLYNVSLTADTWINISLYFYNEKGNLELYLLYPNLTTAAMSMSFSDNEFIFYYVEFSAIFTIWIFYDDNLNLNYNLSIHETTAVWDDDFENNDWFDQATTLTEGIYNNLSAIDWDTYKIYCNIGFQITIILDYNYSIGNLDLYLIEYDIYDPYIAWIIDVSSSITNQERLVFETDYSGYYYFLVYLDDINMGYNLTIIKNEIPGDDDDDDSTSTQGTVGIPGFTPIFMIIASFATILLLIKKKEIFIKKYGTSR